MIARPRLAALLLIGSLAGAACGDDTTTPAAAESLPAAPTVPPSAPATAATAATATTAATSDAECDVERTTLEVAVEAFFAENGRVPATEAELVEQQLLRAEIGAYDLMADTGELVRVAGVACDEIGSAADVEADAEPVTVELILEQLGPEGVDGVGGVECATELAEIAVAAESFIAREGREPETLDDLSDLLDADIQLWTFDTERRTLVPAPGSPCVDIVAATARTAAEVCETEARTLTVAAEAYTAEHGAPPSSEDELVGPFLREPIQWFDLEADGAVVPVPGGQCDPAVLAATTAP